MKITVSSLSLLGALGIQLFPLNGAEVLSWRNGGNGLYPGARPATDWGSGPDLVWETPLPARSNGCPILVGGKLFFTAEPATLLCAEASSGKILWQRPNDFADLMEMTPEKAGEIAAAQEKARQTAEKLGPLERELYRTERRLRRNRDDAALRERADGLRREIESLKREAGPAAAQLAKPPAHDVNGYSSYTPVSDGKLVWACFGTGVVVCYDLEGRRVWHRRTEAPDHDWGGASSPTLAGGKLIVRFKDYLALDPATGEELWRTPSGGVVFNCPANFELDGRHYLYTARGELIRASDGRKLPSQDFVGTAKPWCFFNTPSVSGNRVYCAHGSEGEQGDAYALEIPASADQLEKDGLKVVWHKQVDKNRYYSSPLVHEGIVYLISREYRMQALEASTGNELWTEKIRGFTGTAYPSLTLAGELIFVGAEDGNAAFVKTGRRFEEVARTRTDPFRSTPLFDGGWTYLRTQEHLKAFRSK